MGIHSVLGMESHLVSEGQIRIETFLSYARINLLVGEQLRDFLMELPLVNFRDVVISFRTKKFDKENIDEEKRERIRQDEAALELFKKLLEQVVRERHICDTCYSGTMSDGRAGRNYYGSSRCSNTDCVFHTHPVTVAS